MSFQRLLVFQVTHDDGKFDSFPMLNYAGTKIVWGSSRNGSDYEINLFIADWVDPPKSNAAILRGSLVLASLIFLLMSI